MSFKRAGNDHCALRLQKKQRVAELFAEDIPADEVAQTRSGRFVCLVCPHNPVLDTMPMLSIHRQGKKHLANMSIRVEKEHDLNELLQKHKQELFMKEAGISNKPSDIERFPLNDSISDTAPLLTKTKLLTESITKLKDAKFSRVQPWERTSANTGRLVKNKNKPFFQSRVELKLGKGVFDKDFEKSTSLVSFVSDNTTHGNVDHKFLESSKKNLSKGISGKCLVNSGSLFSTTKVKGKESSQTCSSKLSSITKAKSGDNKTSVQGRQTVHDSYLARTNEAIHRKQLFTSLPEQDSVPYSQEILGYEVTNADGGEKVNRELQKRYLELRMSGWILDSNGKWIKDENVEFDSDEDEPDLAK